MARQFRHSYKSVGQEYFLCVTSIANLAAVVDLFEFFFAAHRVAKKWPVAD